MKQWYYLSGNDAAQYVENVIHTNESISVSFSYQCRLCFKVNVRVFEQWKWKPCIPVKIRYRRNVHDRHMSEGCKLSIEYSIETFVTACTTWREINKKNVRKSCYQSCKEYRHDSWKLRSELNVWKFPFILKHSWGNTYPSSF